MHPIADVAVLALSLAAAPSAVESAVPNVPDDELFVGLDIPVPIEDVRVVLDVSEGIDLALSYQLPELGPVAIAVRVEDDGSGLGLVTVGDAIVSEIGLVEGVVDWERTDLMSLRTAQAHVFAASIVQIWQQDEVTEALLAASRDGKCAVAGKIAGASTGTLVAAGCFLFVKKKWCIGAGSAVFNKVSGWISGKCDEAQNG